MDVMMEMLVNYILKRNEKMNNVQMVSVKDIHNIMHSAQTQDN